MSWSPERTRQHADAMARTAEVNRCPECGRGSGLVTRYSLATGRPFMVCRWIDQSKCTFAPNSLAWKDEPNPFALG